MPHVATRCGPADRRLTLETDVLADTVRDGAVEALLLGHLLAHIGPGELVELVDRRRDGTRLLSGHAGELKDAVEDLAVVELDGVLWDLERIQRLAEDVQDLGVGNHGVVGAGNVKVALVELAHAALAHHGLVAAVYFCDVVALHVGEAVHGDVARKGDREVVAQRALLAALVVQVVDQLRVLAVLARQDVAELKHGRVNRLRTVLGKDALERRKDPFPQQSGRRLVVQRALRHLELEVGAGLLVLRLGRLQRLHLRNLRRRILLRDLERLDLVLQRLDLLLDGRHGGNVDGGGVQAGSSVEGCGKEGG